MSQETKQAIIPAKDAILRSERSRRVAEKLAGRSLKITSNDLKPLRQVVSA